MLWCHSHLVSEASIPTCTCFPSETTFWLVSTYYEWQVVLWNNWRAQWKKGITVFDESKRSKVNEAFSLSSKLLWLKFNSWICVLLKSSLVIFLDTKKLLLTFWDYQKRLSPFSTGPFNWTQSISLLCSSLFYCWQIVGHLHKGCRVRYS